MRLSVALYRTVLRAVSSWEVRAETVQLVRMPTTET
jgi:hypothetical protein